MTIPETVNSLAAAAAKAADTASINAPISNDEKEVMGKVMANGLHNALGEMRKAVGGFYDIIREANAGDKAMGEELAASRAESEARYAAAVKVIEEKGEFRQAMLGFAVIGAVAVGAVVHAVQRHRGKHAERLAAERQTQLSAQAGLSR